MTIKSIYIYNNGASSAIKIGADLRIAAGSGMHIDVNQARSMAEISSISQKSIYDKAVDELAAAGSFLPGVMTINGVAPRVDDGAFWILPGDACGAWTPMSEGSDNFDTLVLTDLCPACQTCRELAKVRAMLERVRIMLNAEKDKNLYDTQVATARKDAMVAQLDELPSDCDTASEESVTFPATILSRELLWQYMTVVHMWNYVVAQNNAETEIRVAPESTTGFYIQTKRALPICEKINPDAGIELEVTISPDVVEDNLSLLVLGPSMSFEPFQSSWSLPDAETVHQDATTKIFRFSTKAKYAGTFLFNVKLISFRYGELTNVNGDVISLDDIDWDEFFPEATSKIIDGRDRPVTRYQIGYTLTEKQLVQATIEDYENSAKFPSKSPTVENNDPVQGLNVWDVMIKWKLCGLYADSGAAGVKEFDEHYKMTTSKCRVFLDDLLPDSVLIDLKRTMEEDGNPHVIPAHPDEPGSDITQQG